MTSYEIRATFPAWAPVLMADAEYAKPTLRWLTADFYPWFQRTRFNLGLHKWQRKSDCDDFARAYAQAASDCHALTSGNDTEGIAVGQFWFHAKRGPHAIVVAFTDQGKVFIEPQTGERLHLTQEEENTCFAALF